MQEWPIPTCIKEPRSFPGFAWYYRRFVASFATITKPLNDLLVGHPTNNKGKIKKVVVS